jgi:hypothetical protein
MKKNYFFKFILFLIPISAIVFVSASAGRDGAFSGSPGDSSNTCTSCHSGGNFGATVAIQTEVPAGGYGLDTSYGIQVDITGSSGSKHGFQITAERISDNTKVGTFTADGTDNQLKNGGTHLTHTSAGNSKKTWNFNWKSPATDVGAIKFYVAALAADGTGNTGGDQTVTASTGNFNVLGIAKEKQLDFALYPNPSSDHINVQLPSGVTKADLNVFDISGRLVRTTTVSSLNKLVNIADLTSGIYVLKIHSEGKTGAKQFVKK